MTIIIFPLQSSLFYILTFNSTKDNSLLSMKATFTIIIPIFQEVRILAMFLESLTATITAPSQVIFINDGSGVEVQILLEKTSMEFPETIAVTIITNGYPLGSGNSINKALEIASGEYITILDSDIILSSNWQHILLATFYSDLKIGAVGALLLYPQTGGIQHCGLAFSEDAARHLFLNASPDYVPSKLYQVQSVIFAFCTIKSEVISKVGILDDQYCNAYEDMDYNMRINEAGYIIVVNPALQAFHWERSNGPLRNLNRKNNLARFWRKWGNTIKPDIWDFTLEKLIAFLNEVDTNIQLKGIDLSSIRGDAKTLWKKLLQAGIFESQKRYS